MTVQSNENSFFFSDLRLNYTSKSIDFPSPPDIEFSFPIPPSSNNTHSADKLFYRGRLLPINKLEESKPTVPHSNHRRVVSLDREATRTDQQRLRRASTDPRQCPATTTWQKWPLFVLGTVRVPAEMEMKDMRIRQRRIGNDVADGVGQKSRWRILRALSCKAAESIAVSPPAAGGGFCP